MTPRLNREQRQAINYLVAMRHAARKTILTEQSSERWISTIQENINCAKKAHDKEAERIFRIHLDNANEILLRAKFNIIETGKHLAGISSIFDTIPRECWLRALCVNESEWNTDDMRKYGKSLITVVSVLDLENSATVDDGIEFKPLKWCCTMAMMNAIKTNPKFGRVIHDECNKVFGGALDKVFGEWKEPSVLERLGVSQ